MKKGLRPYDHIAPGVVIAKLGPDPIPDEEGIATEDNPGLVNGDNIVRILSLMKKGLRPASVASPVMHY